MQADVHILILNARRLQRLLDSPNFISFFNSLRIEERDILVDIIKRVDYNKVYTFYKDKLVKDIGELSIRELRIEASKLHIARYSVMTKEDLLRNIANEKARDPRSISSRTSISDKDQSDPEDSCGSVIERDNGSRLPNPAIIVERVKGITFASVEGCVGIS